MEEEFQGEPTLGGHNFVFIDELSPGQACPICLLAMRRPVQTVCGHRFCHICLLESFRECAVPVCPADRNRIPQNAGFFPDMAWERDILSLRVKCKRSERGCDWTGQLRHYEEHFSICQYEDVTCGDCEEEMQRGFLYGHTTSECPQRIVQCAHCNEEFAFSFTKFHEEECGRFPLECSQGCDSQIPREELNSHLRDDCGMTMVVCSYQGAGCTFYDKRNQLENHLEIGRKEHLSKTWSRLRELKNENSSMRKLLDRKSGEMNELQRQLEEVRFTASNDQVEIGQLKHLVFTMCLEGMDDRLEHPTRKSKGILEKFKIRKPRSSRQEQNGKKENPFMERSWSSMRNLSHPSSQK